MAIGARVTPELVVVGVVSESRSRNWEGEDRGKRVTLETNGGPLNVGFQKEQAHAVPMVGESVALVTSVYDGPNGSTLSYVRHLTAGDLDSIHSASGLVAAASSK